MIILAIETSCDETGISILKYSSDEGSITLLGNALASQVDLHAKYGGVFPAMAKRAHAEKFVPLLVEAMSQAGLLQNGSSAVDESYIRELCSHEPVLAENLIEFFNTHAVPALDAVAVTAGPGLEPALWVGINAAKVLAKTWQKPLYPINHMEGHVVTALVTRTAEKTFSIPTPALPILSLLVSGGHTELVLMDALGSYQKIGQTKDDAVGEAFDKVARMLGLPYPGGPAVSRLAALFRASGEAQEITLPRPMLHSGSYDFSYSGIKTAVLYTIRDLAVDRELTEKEKMMIAAAFEDAAIEVLVKKTIAAAKEYRVRSIVVGGGVAGNSYLKNELTAAVEKHPGVALQFPEMWLATDNAVMIGLAACLQFAGGTLSEANIDTLRANGNLSIANK